jgi:multiple sugar transport system permease protein
VRHKAGDSKRFGSGNSLTSLTCPNDAHVLQQSMRRLGEVLPNFRLTWAEGLWNVIIAAGCPRLLFFAAERGSLVSFSIGRMRLRHGWIVSNAALLTYVIPSSFLAIPFYRIMQKYGLTNDLWSVIAAEVTFATPYAIFIFQQYGVSIPMELDEAARIDGASPIQVYLHIYLPLMAPALVAVGTYALLLAWNEYLYQFLLLSSKKNMTVPVALAQFLNSDEAPWNYMMATAIVYALPPVAIYYAFRRRMIAGLTMGGVKG